jgi:alanyl-tRNA synthetase
MTERLYYLDSYLKEFRASVLETSGDGRVYLDRTALYPASGGQPHDRCSIGGVPILEVIDEGERIAHVAAAAVPLGEAECRVDWPRRFDHMQQHTGQHLLSAALIETCGARTVSFHLGAESSAIDVAAATLSEAEIAAAEIRANEIVFENRPVRITFEDSRNAAGLRAPTDREGTLRIVAIEDYDRSACGGTHVRSTAEIGPILIGKVERAHGNVRIEFLCGMRAVKRAHADFENITRIARVFSAPPSETPALVAAQVEALDAAEKSRRKLAGELARRNGVDLYAATAPDASGLRHASHRISKGALDDEVRALAQGFVSGSKACFLAVSEDPPSVLLAVSKDAGIHAGNLVKEAVTSLGGRGGGNPQTAQGSVPGRDGLEPLVARLRAATLQPR